MRRKDRVREHPVLTRTEKNKAVRFGNFLCKKHGKPANQKVTVPVYLETGEWMPKLKAWNWLVEGSRTWEEPVSRGVDFYASAQWRSLRYEVLRASRGCCDLCGRSHASHGIVLHVDHKKPRSTHPHLALDRNNLQVLCEDCNFGKSNRDDTDWTLFI